LAVFQRAGFGRIGFVFACFLALALALLTAPHAHAARLLVAPDAPGWMHLGADILLWLHIGGGGVGIATGLVALASRKGGRIHRSVGKVFFGAMLVSYGVAAAVAPFMHVEQRTNTTAGLLALYLLLSGWAAVQQKEIKAGPYHIAGLVAALGAVGIGAMFMQMGEVDGAPSQAFVLFVVVGAVAAAGEINVLARRSLKGPARLARHLWRMCMSLFVASGSFFLGQMRFLPDWLIESRLNLVLALTPGVLMLVYLVVVRLPKRKKARPASVAATAK
jgi:hypothetical protein